MEKLLWSWKLKLGFSLLRFLVECVGHLHILEDKNDINIHTVQAEQDEFGQEVNIATGVMVVAEQAAVANADVSSTEKKDSTEKVCDKGSLQKKKTEIYWSFTNRGYPHLIKRGLVISDFFLGYFLKGGGHN